MCDASAALALSERWFVVANDEDNVLRVYDRDRPGRPRQTFEISALAKPDPDHPEIDLEGSTRLGQTVYWIASHGTNSEGKRRASRRRFFATQFIVDADQVTLRGVGKPYEKLVQDFAAAEHLRKYELAKAAQRIPKGPDGLNVEALAAAPDGALWIGLRNPLAKGKAILIPLANPREVISGQRARLGAPIELDLGGLGFRSLEYWPERKAYLIVAGPVAAGPCRLFLWSGRAEDAPAAVPGLDLRDWSVESFVLYGDNGGRSVQLLSDDGARGNCKQLPDADLRTFRAGWVRF